MVTAKRQIKFLDSVDVRKVIDIIPDDRVGLRDKALLEVLFSTGLRVSEALALKSEQIKAVTGTMELTVIGKGGYQRVVFFSPVALSAVEAYKDSKPETEELLFDFTPRTAQRMIKRRAISAGLIQRVTPHTMRHSFATDLLRRGIDIRVVQRFLGHKSITSTMVYTGVTDLELANIHKRLYS